MRFFRDKIHLQISYSPDHDPVSTRDELIIDDILEDLSDVLITKTYETVSQSDISKIVLLMEFHMFFPEDV